MKKQPVTDLTEKLRSFASERDWDQFHSPKNLVMALSVEVSELMEHFQWLTEEQSSSLPPKKLQQVREEIGDVLIYLTRLADKLGVDMLDAAAKKLEVNRAKYPAEKVRGSAKKYTDL
ncbi:MAG: nucleotide pyrophosphohydrolase [Desulfobulbia bacterium]